jgi:NTE family protein
MTNHYLLITTIIATSLVSACGSVGVIDNQPIADGFNRSQSYSIPNYLGGHITGQANMFLAFSGGGTRAAALAYGVMKELRATTFEHQGRTVSLLDEADRISSVSGGSFTAAYYGLFGDRIFTDFETVFLRKDIQSDLTAAVLNPINLLGRVFTSKSRTEAAVEYYDRTIFEGKTFADMFDTDRPFVVINATDLAAEAQFMFMQPQFDFLCSDLGSFKVARAVAASSAVPIVFDPVLLERYSDCGFSAPKWLLDSERRARETGDRRLAENVRAFRFYLRDGSPRYAALVDGGLTDNIGLRALSRTLSLVGDRKAFYQKRHGGEAGARRFVVIAVNASTTVKTGIGETREMPSLGATLGALTDVQLHLYNTETNALVKERLYEWAEELSTPEAPITIYFIAVEFSGVADRERREVFNNVPTSFSLSDEQVDQLIEVGGELLRQNPEYLRLLADLGAERR